MLTLWLRPQRHIAKHCQTKIVTKTKHSIQQAECCNVKRQNYTTMLNTIEEVDMGEQKNPVWCNDSGCTGHMCNDKHMIQGFTRLDNE